jgi:hypothetical protein
MKQVSFERDIRCLCSAFEPDSILAANDMRVK